MRLIQDKEIFYICLNSKKQIGDLEDLRMLIQTNQDKLFFATIFISVNAESLEDLNEKTKILESELIKKLL